MTPAARKTWLHATWLLVLLVVAWPTVHFLWFHWTASVWHNGHGILVPFIVAYLVHHRLAQEPREVLPGSAWGLPMVGLGLSLMLVDTAIGTELLSAFGLLLCIPGLSLLLLGTERTRILLVPWLVCFLMLPIPKAFLSQIHLVLRKISTAGSAVALRALDIPHVAGATRIELAKGAVEVVDACSGWSATYAAVTIAIVLAYTSSSFWYRVAILALAVPLAVFFNVVRVGGMVLMGHFQGFGFLDTWMHEGFGYLSFMGALVVLFSLARREARSRRVA